MTFVINRRDIAGDIAFAIGVIIVASNFCTANDTSILDKELSNISSHSVIHLNQSVLHYVTKVRHIANLINVTFNGPAEITCAEGVGLVFVNITGLTLNNITIRKCGVTGDELANINDIVQNIIITSYQFRARIRVGLFVIGSTNLTLQNVTITETQGIGMVCVNVLGLVTLSDVTFHSNRPASIEECSKCLVPFVSSEEACVFNPSSVSGSLLLLYADNRHDYSAPNTQVNIVGNKFIDNLSCSLTNIANSQGASSPSLSRGYQNATSTAGIMIVFSQRKGTYNVIAEIISSLFRNNSGFFGSAISVETYRGASTSNVSIENCRFLQNGMGFIIPDTITQGGAIGVLSNLQSFKSNFINETLPSDHFLSIHNCSFLNNSASIGGAVLLVDQLSSSFYVHISECHFEGNEGLIGIGLAITGKQRESVSVTLSNSSLVSNSVPRNYFNRNLRTSVIFLEIIDAIFIDVSLTHNIGTAVHLSGSDLFLHGTVLFEENDAFLGGALYLQSFSKIVVKDNTNVSFLSNQAFANGGAVFLLNEYIFPCFLYFGSFDLYCLLTGTCFSESANISVSFINNTAISGSAIHGNGLDCPWLYQMGFNKSDHVFNFIEENFCDVLKFSPSITEPMVVASYSEKINISHSNVTIMPGQLVSVQATAIDSFGRNVISVISAQASSISEDFSAAVIQDHGIGLLEPDSNQTSNIQINGTQSDSTIVRIYSVYTGAEGNISVQFTNCSSFGYVYNDTYHACVCAPDILSSDVTCDYTNGKLIRPTDKWIGELNGDILVLSCLNHYCSEHRSVDSMDLDGQCADNRAGLLCGGCRDSCSATIDFTGCSCNGCSEIQTLVVWLVVNSALCFWFVGSTVCFHYYVSDGFLYGQIFYMSTIYVFREVLFYRSSSLTDIITSSLVVRGGCLYEGMTTLMSSALIFALPTYVFLVMGIITLLAKKCDCFNKRISFSIPKSFATLIYFTYNWLLNGSFTILVMKPITTSSGIEYRWRIDPNVKYFHGWHAVLGVASIIILLLLSSLAVILLFPKIAYQFRVVQRLKPLMDAFQAPFKLKYSFWIGLQLIIRLLFYILVIFVPEDYQLYCLCLIIISLLYALTAFLPYKNHRHYLLDNMFLIFLIILIVEVNVLPKILVVSLICYFAAYIMYLGGAFYCLINRFPGLKLAVKRRLKCFHSSHKQQTEIHQDVITYSTKIHSYDSAKCIELRESLLVIEN
ncbi:uncharacterized protein [Dysidea avara]|uniref:uncharacterized protein isoform X1 n=2 Tax=Dysidea avara TaxID=196820 RepID=UPI003318B821